ncbi:hypothetical protein MNQ98_27955 [Paenibacillus sp. N3/727]|uniref:hypothetical protein n=1 Tax=Paenibacillus sp. N3/727 TaxID=2925845 RepID=UPI001F53D493|nr:hypothetical protein [Paenibacillus sp. N3/727]UNK18200.1 hypothetical protein MNQ98_27955 [Paenibacillus sp. N3/727]
MKKHQWVATLLSLICTGLGMFYIGTPGMIVGGTILMALQGASLFIFFMTLGFLGLIVAPVALGVHIVGLIITVVYFNYRTPKDPFKAQKRQRQFSSPWKIAVRTVIGLALFVGAVYGGYTTGSAPFTKSGAEKRAVLEAAESYLEQKYNESFKVTDVRYTWATGTYYLKAHPEQNPEQVFRLESNDDNPPEISNDNYLNELWALQLKEILTPLVDELYQNTVVLSTWVNVGHNKTVERNYNNLISENGAAVGSQHVSLTVFTELTADNLSTEQERVMELIRRMPEVMVEGETGIQIDYYPSDLNTPGNVKKINKGTFDGDFNGGKQTHMLRVDDTSEIKSANDIEIRDLSKD